jgi:hypothetical protein
MIQLVKCLSCVLFVKAYRKSVTDIMTSSKYSQKTFRAYQCIRNCIEEALNTNSNFRAVVFILTGITANVILCSLSSIHLRCQILPLSYLFRAIVRILPSQFRHIDSFVQSDYQTSMGDDG